MRKLWESGKSHIEREREKARKRESERERERAFLSCPGGFPTCILAISRKDPRQGSKIVRRTNRCPCSNFFRAWPFYSSLKLHSKFQKLRVLRTSFTKNELKLKGYISCFTAGLTQLERDCCSPLPPSTKIFRSWWTFSKVHQKVGSSESSSLECLKNQPLEYFTVSPFSRSSFLPPTCPTRNESRLFRTCSAMTWE